MSELLRSRTVPGLLAMKAGGQKIAALTAYDASFAAAMDDAGVDMILVGDSLGMVIQGYPTTLPVSLDHMVYHAAAVARGGHRPVLAVDLPFMSYATVSLALDSAARLVREGGAQMVKLEGGRVREEVIRALAQQNIPVCAHLGLLPQSVHRLGGYRVQGRDERSADTLLEDALILQDAGASVLFLECVPTRLAGEVTAALSIPTIGIGAGAGCDGQILVSYDMLGVSSRCPKFCKNFLSETGEVREAFRQYVADVREGVFPGADHSF
ncbi:MAG: 3-methyl-2-oxobutanoate hydroxymethyltransferase [Methylococcaceae bacterium]|jgi:3-methyl-2-oxobutanoate hydroxymethyltransferase